MDTLRAVFTNEIFVQGIAFVGLAVYLIATQCKTYKKIAFFRILSEFIFATQFLLLGGYTGAATNYASCVTNSIYGWRIRKGKSTLPFQIAFGLLFMVLGLLTWDGPVTLLAVGAKLASTVALGINDPRMIRLLNCVSGPLWIIYDVIYMSIGGIISDSIGLIFVLVAVVRFDILGRKKEETV